eukprot:m.164665 g.164665  ORF g.164665 m.164665 type:complete len:84 (+) comp38885_c0_seq15:2059-2310(+)
MDVAKKSDVFSYGVILWEIRERKFPFAGMPTSAIQYAITSGKKLPEGNAEAPLFYNSLINDCTAYEPKFRPSFCDIINILSTK